MTDAKPVAREITDVESISHLLCDSECGGRCSMLSAANRRQRPRRPMPRAGAIGHWSPNRMHGTQKRMRASAPPAPTPWPRRCGSMGDTATNASAAALVGRGQYQTNAPAASTPPSQPRGKGRRNNDRTCSMVHRPPRPHACLERLLSQILHAMPAAPLLREGAWLCACGLYPPPRLRQAVALRPSPLRPRPLCGNHARRSHAHRASKPSSKKRGSTAGLGKQATAPRTGRT